ncbi:hypothetical protein JCM24511_06205 [Saitozyma sp. JCM 24511]|nr:hypothetical protein JCM24511_06205 [Saitozyma sp. JCM 24511]
MKLSIIPAFVCLTALVAPSLATPTKFHERAKPNKCGPSGAHANGGPACSVSLDGTMVTCHSYTIGGVGNTNANEVLSATWTALVTCTNNGGKTVTVKTQAASAPFSDHLVPNTNGQLTVDPLTAKEPSTADFLAQASCPNPNWTKALQAGSPKFSSFLYTLTFVGFESCGPFITQAG